MLWFFLGGGFCISSHREIRLKAERRRSFFSNLSLFRFMSVFV
jgi:hypothetical protein